MLGRAHNLFCAWFRGQFWACASAGRGNKQRLIGGLPLRDIAYRCNAVICDKTSNNWRRDAYIISEDYDCFGGFACLGWRAGRLWFF